MVPGLVEVVRVLQHTIVTHFRRPLLMSALVLSQSVVALFFATSWRATVHQDRAGYCLVSAWVLVLAMLPGRYGANRAGLLICLYCHCQCQCWLDGATPYRASFVAGKLPRPSGLSLLAAAL